MEVVAAPPSAEELKLREEVVLLMQENVRLKALKASKTPRGPPPSPTATTRTMKVKIRLGGKLIEDPSDDAGRDAPVQPELVRIPFTPGKRLGLWTTRKGMLSAVRDLGRARQAIELEGDGPVVWKAWERALACMERRRAGSRRAWSRLQKFDAGAHNALRCLRLRVHALRLSASLVTEETVSYFGREVTPKEAAFEVCALVVVSLGIRPIPVDPIVLADELYRAEALLASLQASRDLHRTRREQKPEFESKNDRAEPMKGTQDLGLGAPPQHSSSRAERADRAAMREIKALCDEMTKAVDLLVSPSPGRALGQKREQYNPLSEREPREPRRKRSRKYEALEAENASLKTENDALRAEVKRLRVQNERLVHPGSVNAAAADFATLTSRTRDAKSMPKATGRWTTEEHDEFLKCLDIYGLREEAARKKVARGQKWMRVADHITTRTAVQIRSHAQDYFKKIGASKSEAVLNGGPGWIGAYSPEARKRRVARFHGKRARRVWTKRVKYDVRKNFAETRLRVKGRFVKKEEEDLLKDLVGVV